MSAITLIGILGAIFLGACGLPQAIMSFKQKHSEGIAPMFLTMWTLGEICYLIYGWFTGADAILMANYVFNLILLVVIVYYKIRGLK